MGLPNQVYSGVLELQWQTDPQERFNVDLGLGIGVHSDFKSLTGDSIRLTGHALFNLAINEDTTFRGGVVYYDRLDLKILRQLACYGTHTRRRRIDLFFPRPRISQYFTTINNYDAWWYYGAEYGGGSWTMQQDGGGKTQTDINDIRLTTGFEFGLAGAYAGENISDSLRLGWSSIGKSSFVIPPQKASTPQERL